MTAATAPERTVPPPSPPRQPLGLRLLRWLGWLLIGAGVVVLLYLVYSLLFTNLETGAAQGELQQRWEAAAPTAAADDAPPAVDDAPPAVDDAPTSAPDADPQPVPEAGDDPEPTAEGADPGGAVAILEFRRAGSQEPVVHEDPLFVVGGVSAADLTRGPGHYPGTAAPGGEGNFAVAGHRTTYGAPFFHLDRLAVGDEVIVTDRQRQVWTYRVAEERIVAPTDASVLGPDPLGGGRPVLTLTTCHPRFSNRQRLVVFAELVDGPTDGTAGSAS